MNNRPTTARKLSYMKTTTSGDKDGELDKTEKYKKMKEVQSRYSMFNKSKTIKQPTEVHKSNKKSMRKTVTFDSNDVETQTQFSKTHDEATINELNQYIQDLRNQREIRESQLSLEITMLKAKLEEQAQINLATKKLLALENRSLDLLTTKIDSYLKESEKIEIDNDLHVENDSETLSSKDMATKVAETKENLSSNMSDGGNSASTMTENASKEFDSKYAKLKAKVESILEINKRLREELNVKKKRDSSKERKITDDDKASVKESTPEERRKSLNAQQYENSYQMQQIPQFGIIPISLNSGNMPQCKFYHLGIDIFLKELNCSIVDIMYAQRPSNQ